MNSSFWFIPLALLLAVLMMTASAAPVSEEVRAEPRMGGGGGLMGKKSPGFGFGMDEPPPPPPIQPGITTIFYSPFFPVLPPQPYGQQSYGGGAPYGNGPPMAGGFGK